MMDEPTMGDVRDQGIQAAQDGSDQSQGTDVSTSSSGSSWMDKILADSPPKDVAAYNDHPLNFTGDEWLSRIIRGVEGILGDLNLAVVDILIGIIEGVYDQTATRSENGNDAPNRPTTQ